MNKLELYSDYNLIEKYTTNLPGEPSANLIAAAYPFTVSDNHLTLLLQLFAEKTSGLIGIISCRTKV